MDEYHCARCLRDFTSAEKFGLLYAMHPGAGAELLIRLCAGCLPTVLESAVSFRSPEQIEADRRR